MEKTTVIFVIVSVAAAAFGLYLKAAAHRTFRDAVATDGHPDFAHFIGTTSKQP